MNFTDLQFPVGTVFNNAAERQGAGHEKSRH
jgi:hypothetical protein